jgi:putative oxidoreductase
MFKHLMKHYPDLGLLALRIGLGVVFVAHGWQKLQDMDQVVGFFASLGLASFFAYLVALTEFVGGIAVLLGLYVEIAGWLIAVVMFFAIVLVKGKLGFLGGYELDVALLMQAVSVALLGSGAYSVQKHLPKK